MIRDDIRRQKKELPVKHKSLNVWREGNDNW